MEQSKFIIVSFLKPQELNFEFTKWPNHITIVPWMRTDQLKSFICEVTKKCQITREISYKIGQIDYFGPNKDVLVSRIEKNEELQNLHVNLLEIALKLDNKINLTFCKNNYLPHITHHEKPYPELGEIKLLKHIYVAELVNQNCQLKKVVAVVPLK
jgi:hypothetical protein